MKELEYRTVPDCILMLSCCKTVSSYRDGYRINSRTVFCISSTDVAHASITQKAKNTKRIFVPVLTSRGFLTVCGGTGWGT